MCWSSRAASRGRAWAFIGANEQRIHAPESNRAHGALDGVGVQLLAAVIEIEDQPVPVVQGVAHRLSQRGTAGDTLQLLRISASGGVV